MNFYLYLFLLIIFPFQIFSQEIVVGNIYESQITNFKNKKLNVPLPPGKWKATESEKGGMNWKLWWKATLINENDGGELYLAIPYVQSGADTWAGGSMKKCGEWIQDEAKNILAQGAKRSNPQRTYCISERNDNWLHINLNTRTMNTPIKYYYYDLYYPLRSINMIEMNNKNTLIAIGETGMNGLARALNGDSSNFSIFGKLLKDGSFANSNSLSDSSSKFSNLSNFSVCRSAMKNDGSGWVKYNDYVEEATSRSLTIYKCRDILNIKDKAEVKKKDNNTVKSKLEELKILLDDGLISKDQYDEKSSQLLDEL